MVAIVMVMVVVMMMMVMVTMMVMMIVMAMVMFMHVVIKPDEERRLEHASNKGHWQNSCGAR
jgi:hypothetical protein